MKHLVFIVALADILFSCKSAKKTEEQDSGAARTDTIPTIEEKNLHSKYLFTRASAKINTAVKIEIGKDGTPKYLHVKDLRESETSKPIDKIALQPMEVIIKNLHTPPEWIGYQGDSTQTRGGRYTVKYPQSAQEIARMIEKEEMPTLHFYAKDSRGNFTGTATEKLTKKQWKKLTEDDTSSAEEQLTPELEYYFNSECRDTAGLLPLPTNSSNSIHAVINGRTYKNAGYYYNDEEKGCRHYFYGLESPAVVEYLKACHVTCLTDNSPAPRRSPFFFQFENFNFILDCKDEKFAFHIKNNKLHIVEDENGKWVTSWIDCKTGNHGNDL